MAHQIELTVSVEELLPPDFEHTVVCRSVFKDDATGDYHCEIKGLDQTEWITLKTSDTFRSFGLDILIKEIHPANDGRAARVLISY